MKPQWNEPDYIKYLETRCEVMQSEIDQLKATATILMIRLNLGRDLKRASTKLFDLCRNRSAAATRIIRAEYGKG